MGQKWNTENPEKVKELKRAWYERNKQDSLDKLKIRKQEIRQWLRSLKEGQKCLYCTESHPACLDYHHRDATEKKFNISDSPTRGYSKETILLEIAKCDLVCSNCHRKLHDDVDLV